MVLNGTHPCGRASLAHLPTPLLLLYYCPTTHTDSQRRHACAEMPLLPAIEAADRHAELCEAVSTSQAARLGAANLLVTGLQGSDGDAPHAAH